MKKLLIVTLLLLAAAGGVHAQDTASAAPAKTAKAIAPVRYFMEIESTRLSGQRVGTYFIHPGRIIASETGMSEVAFRTMPKEHSLGSLTDIMNYLSKFGWEFVDSYTTSTGSTTSTFWIVAKSVYSPMELLDGFVSSKADKKK